MPSDMKVIEGGLGHDDKDEAIRQYRLTRERIARDRKHREARSVGHEKVQPMNVVLDDATKVVDFKLRR